MTTHQLKTWPEYFASIIDGTKMFEVRKADRSFKVGDTLLLREWLPHVEGYTGREARRNVDYVLDGGQFGIEPGFCVMSIS